MSRRRWRGGLAISLAAASWFAYPATALSASAFKVTFPGLEMGSPTPKGAPEAWAAAYQLWNDGYVEIPIRLPETGFYVFTLRTAVIEKDGHSALVELRLDQRPLPVGRTFSREIRATSQQDFRWASVAASGEHRAQISLVDHDGNPRAAESLLIYALTIERATSEAAQGSSVLPPDPPGNRDPRKQPFSSFSLWNTALGAGARWSGDGDDDTRDLRRPGAHINAGEWSMPIYSSSPDRPAIRFHDSDPTYPISDVLLRPPREAVPAAPAQDGDHHMIVYNDDNSKMYSFFGCKKMAAGFECGQSQIDDACGEALGGYGWGAGIIRRWEIESGSIRHMLRFTLPTAATRAGSSWISGLAWPADRSDYQGPRGLYTGHVLYGSTIGIPAEVDLSSLDLTPSGLVLAHTLQDYGALQRDTGGDKGVNFFAEPSAEGLRQLSDMREDLNKIVPVLAVLRNQDPDSPNGGGVRRRLPLDGLDPAICPPRPRSSERAAFQD